MKRKMIIVIFVIYISMIIKITIIRSGLSFSNLFEKGKINAVPFVDLINIFKNNGIVQFLYLFIGNIIWFIPLGYFLPVIINRKFNVFEIMLSSFCLSLFIEFIQFMFGTGISELDDLILNTVGAIIGFYTYKIIK